MIPDIALMIVVYGAARLLVAAIEPHRRSTGTTATAATGVTWMITVLAIGALAILGLAVLDSSSSLSDLTK